MGKKIIHCIGPCCENEAYIRELEALIAAAQYCVHGHTFDCAIQRSGKKKPKCVCGFDYFSAALEKHEAA